MTGSAIAQSNRTRLLPLLYAVRYWRVLLAEQCRRNPPGGVSTMCCVRCARAIVRRLESGMESMLACVR